MRRGFLSDYFVGIAAKRLSAVEADRRSSNQHEFNGTVALRQILGDERRTIPAKLLYVTDNEEARVAAEASLTWYQARKPPRSEYRFYFPSSPVSEQFHEGDLLIVGCRPDGSALVIVAAQATTVEGQLLWLFGTTASETSFSSATFGGEDDLRIGHVVSLILEELEIEADVEAHPDLLVRLFERFDSTFPSTEVFSAFARETLPAISSLDDPDAAVEAWIDQEELLFRALERRIVADRLKAGFGPSGDDVDAFMEFSLSVHNRRKSRAGRALENHLATVFDAFEVDYSRGATTEGRSRPDFIFPGARRVPGTVIPRVQVVHARSEVVAQGSMEAGAGRGRSDQ